MCPDVATAPAVGAATKTASQAGRHRDLNREVRQRRRGSQVFDEHRLDTRTLGAYQCERGLGPGMCEEARIAIAHETAIEAVRLAIIDLLDGIFVGLDRGANPRHIAARLRGLADEISPVVERQDAAE